MHNRAFIVLALLLPACSSDDPEPAGGGGSGGMGAMGGGGGGGGAAATGGSASGGTTGDCPPVDAATLAPFLTSNGYAQWKAESSVHSSTGPHGMVRSYVNDVLFDSLTAGNATHPKCSAVVKELYASDGSPNGHAYWVKTDDDSAAGANIYWYEILNGNVIVDGKDESGCTGCHSSGTDFFRTPFPLQ